MTLLDSVLATAGGRERWARLDRFEVHLTMRGSYLSSKIDSAILKEIVVAGSTRNQTVEVIGVLGPLRNGLCRPNWVGIENRFGVIEASRSVTARHFTRLGSIAQWDDLDVVYYCGISAWNTINYPYFLVGGTFEIYELASVTINEQTWRRIYVQLPEDIATESRRQILYFDPLYQHRRTDYLPSDLTGYPVVHSFEAHQYFSNILVPTLRISRRAHDDGSISRESVLFDFEIFDVKFFGA
jgi:hypothetical protein